MQRPTSVLVFAILNAFFGVMGIFGTLMSLVMFSKVADNTNPLAKIMQDIPAYALFMKITIPISIVASGILVVTAIGLWNLKEWARRTSLWYGVYAIVAGIIGTIVNVVYVMKPMLNNMQTMFNNIPASPGMPTFIVPNFIVSIVVGSIVFSGVIGMLHPALMIFFLTRSKVIAAFREPPPLPAGPPGVSL